jgi:cholesterol transport system auxiliary component
MRNSPNFYAIFRLNSTVLRLATGLPLIAVLGACGIGPQVKEPPASYDLGPQRAYVQEHPRIRTVLLLPGVSAPVWLDSAGIVYRLNYQDAARPQAYANSRWAVPPAQLLTQRIRSRFAAATAGIVTGGDSALADFALRVELEDFSQAFDALNESRVTVRARVTLVDLASHALYAQRTFALERPATPDAAGAVAALGAASDALIEELLGWTVQNLQDRVPK